MSKVVIKLYHLLSSFRNPDFKACEEKMSCQFCMEKLENMVDPRELPCEHVFCLDCLKGDFANNDSHRCI